MPWCSLGVATSAQCWQAILYIWLVTTKWVSPVTKLEHDIRCCHFLSKGPKLKAQWETINFCLFYRCCQESISGLSYVRTVPWQKVSLPNKKLLKIKSKRWASIHGHACPVHGGPHPNNIMHYTWCYVGWMIKYCSVTITMSQHKAKFH